MHKVLKCFTRNFSYEVTYGFRLDFKWYFISVFHDKWNGDVHFLTETFNVFIYLDVDSGGGIYFQTQRAVFYKVKNRTTQKHVMLFFILFLFIRLGSQKFSFFFHRDLLMTPVG